MQRDATVSFVIFRGKIIHEFFGENELNELYHYLEDFYSLVLFFLIVSSLYLRKCTVQCPTAWYNTFIILAENVNIRWYFAHYRLILSSRLNRNPFKPKKLTNKRAKTPNVFGLLFSITWIWILCRCKHFRTGWNQYKDDTFKIALKLTELHAYWINRITWPRTR